MCQGALLYLVSWILGEMKKTSKVAKIFASVSWAVEQNSMITWMDSSNFALLPWTCNSARCSAVQPTGLWHSHCHWYLSLLPRKFRCNFVDSCLRSSYHLRKVKNPKCQLPNLSVSISTLKHLFSNQAVESWEFQLWQLKIHSTSNFNSAQFLF